MDNLNSEKPANEETQGIPMNGYQQVLDMLRVADPTFRESLLRRLAQRDSRLAASLRDSLSRMDYDL